MQQTVREDRFLVLRHASFRLFWFGRIGSSIAFQMFGVAVGWQIYALTGSAWYLGLVGLAQFLPMFLLTIPAGYIADRYDRRRVARICQAMEAVAIAALAAGSSRHVLSRGSILAIVFLIGAARALEGPALHALVPRLVPGPLIARAVTWSASAFQTASIAGPALGGVLYTAGPGIVYCSASALFLASAVLIGKIRIEPAGQKREKVTVKTLLAGIAFIRRRPDILGAISLDLFAVLLGGATALLPVYARDILKTGPWGLGVLRAAPAAGALGMSVLLAHVPLRRRIGRTMFLAVGVFGAATIVFGVSRSFPLSLGALIVLGASDMISVVIRQSLVQIKTPDDMRGRVSAVNSLFIGTSNQLGEFESGATAAWFGVVPAVVLGGAGTIAVILLWMRLFPQLLHADSLDT